MDGGTHGIAGTMRGHEVNVEVDDVAYAVRLQKIHVVIVLVTSAQEKVAVVVGVNVVNGILDRAGAIYINSLATFSPHA